MSITKVDRSQTGKTGHLITTVDTTFTPRTRLKISGLTVADDADNDQTTLTLNRFNTGHIITGNTTFTPRTKLRFSGMNVTDDVINDQTVVSIDRTQTGHLITNTSTTFTPRTKLRITGADIIDDAVNDQTIITITGSSIQNPINTHNSLLSLQGGTSTERYHLTSTQATTVSNLGTASSKNIPATGNASVSEVVYGTDTRLSNTRNTTNSITFNTTNGASAGSTFNGSSPLTVSYATVGADPAGTINYVHPTTSGNKHIPAGGSTGQFLAWSSDGTAIWSSNNDTNTTYTQSVITDTNGAFIRLSGSDSSTDDIKLTSGTNTTVTYTDANTITFSSTDTNTITQLKGTGGTLVSGDIIIEGTGLISTSQSGQTITIATTATSNTGTVTNVSVTTTNGISGTVDTSTTTPAISLSLGSITPTTVNSITFSGTSTPTLSVTGTSSISGSNTGDITLATNSGLSLTNQVVAVGTPSTITSATTNSVSTSTHSHALTVTKADVLLNNVDNIQQEALANKVTSISSSSTDTQYPSAKLVYDKLETKQPIFNGLNDSSLFTVTYDYSTRVCTITYSAGAEVRVGGVIYKKTGSEVTIAHANTSGKYYLYYDNSGTLIITPIVWDIDTSASLRILYYSIPKASYILMLEDHPSESGMSSASHKYNHLTRGTQIRTGGVIANYVPNSTNSLSDIQYSVSAITFMDEDLTHVSGIISKLGSGGTPQTIRIYYRSSDGTWVWDDTSASGLLNNGTNFYANIFTTTWSLAPQTTNNRWINYFVVAIPDVNQSVRTAVVMGQTVHTSLALAQAEDPSISISGWSDFTSEHVFVARITYQRIASSNTFNARLITVQYIRANNVSISTLSPSDHQSLSNRSATDAHPASSITYTPTSPETSTNVQTALDNRPASMNIGTTSVPVNRASEQLTLAGLTLTAPQMVDTVTGTVYSITIVNGVLTLTSIP